MSESDIVEDALRMAMAGGGEWGSLKDKITADALRSITTTTSGREALLGGVMRSAAEAIADGIDEDKSDVGGWKLTSVRWLKQRRAEYVGGTRERGAHGQLKAALGRMNYRLAEAEATSRDRPAQKVAEAEVTDLLSRWGKEEHSDMVLFLEDGGYAGRVETLKAMMGAASPRRRAGWAAAEVPARPTPTEQTLEEVLNDAIENPLAGSW